MHLRRAQCIGALFSISLRCDTRCQACLLPTQQFVFLYNYLRKAHNKSKPQLFEKSTWIFFFLFIRVAQGLTACHISFYLDVFLKRRCVYIQKRFLLPIISTSKTIVSVLDTLERQESALWIGSWELFAEQWQ